MARTPQLRFLQGLAADHATAERFGLPLDEYRDLRDAARGVDRDREVRASGK
ncbi:hypothetical protein [Streptacidiphilus pinicola]|uniref:hypothetical protein n=1 Tax=Streptacidiphilus pinicola TaxID=2219663 RepID=UPI001403EEE4|nr:hypothetical protein [Streptacidiphilus pinicola]